MVTWFWVLFLSATQSLVFVFLRRWGCRRGLLWFLLASAICCPASCVAPVRGGTYFLCRRKESKLRKRAHTASPNFYPRALNVPILHSATLQFLFVAGALNTRLTRFKHQFSGPRHRIVFAPCGQLCVGCRTASVGARNAFWQERRILRRESLHTVCRKWATGVRRCLLANGCKRG